MNDYEHGSLICPQIILTSFRTRLPLRTAFLGYFMHRTFIYARVSTGEQNPENQITEIQSAGFIVESHRIITETISGSMPIARRKGFGRLLDKMEQGDILVVTKLDRLGRDAIDVSTTGANQQKAQKFHEII